MRTAALLLVLAATLAAATTAGARTSIPASRATRSGFAPPTVSASSATASARPRPGAKPTVVLAHMSQGDLCQWEPFARMLAAKGIFVFAFDFRGSCNSSQEPARLRAPRGRRHRGGQGGARPRRAQGLGDRRLTRGIAAVVASANIAPALDGVAAVSAPATIAGRLSAVPAAPRVRVPPSSSRPRTTRTPRTTSRPTRAGSMPRRPPRTRSSGRAGQPARRLPRGQAPGGRATCSNGSTESSRSSPNACRRRPGRRRGGRPAALRPLARIRPAPRAVFR